MREGEGEMGGRERVRERGVRGKGEKREGGREKGGRERKGREGEEGREGERRGRERVRSILAQLLPFTHHWSPRCYSGPFGTAS